MPLEYRTVKFRNDRAGLAERNAYIGTMSNDGWHIVSELIEQGHLDGDQACCLATLCLPLAFLAGRTASEVTVTFAKERITFCTYCGMPLSGRFCTKCGHNRFLGEDANTS